MVCIYCGGLTHVINSRHNKRIGGIWRRRECVGCGNVFTSHEVVDLPSSLMVKTDGTLSPFCRDKLYVSLYQSLGHRLSAVHDASALTETTIKHLLDADRVTPAVIDLPELTRIAYETLNRFDKAAAVHYAAYHSL